MENVLVAPALEVLTGHTSAETALVLEDYPYGVRVRTKIRYWVEKCEKGAKRGMFRFAWSTLNPKTNRWNKPKGEPYAYRVWMYRDPRTGHIRHWAVSDYDIVKGVARLKAMSIWAGLPTEERYDLIDAEAVTRTHALEYHAEWDALVLVVRAAVKAAGCVPADLYERVGSPKWKSDYDLAVALVKAEEFKEYTLPEPD